MVWGDWGLTLIVLRPVEFSCFIANARFPSSLIFSSSTPSIWNQLPTLDFWIQHIPPLPDFCLPSPKPTLDTTVVTTGNTKSGEKILPLSLSLGLSSKIGNQHTCKVTSTTEANTWTTWMLLVGASTWMATVKFFQFVSAESGASKTSIQEKKFPPRKFSSYPSDKDNAWTSLLNPIFWTQGISGHRKLAHSSYNIER